MPQALIPSLELSLMQRTFKTDLVNAQHVEEEFATKLRSKGWNATTTADLGKFSGYDVSATKKDNTYTFEIKNDLKACVSSTNVAIELYRHNKDGMQENSGLSATTADYTIYKILDKFYSISTDDLKKGIKELEDNNMLRTVRGGDNHNTTMALLDFNYWWKNNTKEIK